MEKTNVNFWTGKITYEDPERAARRAQRATPDRVPNPSEKYVTEKGKLDEAIKAIFESEFKKFESDIFLDINTGKISRDGVSMTAGPSKFYDGYDGKILLWYCRGTATISDLKNLIAVTDAKPFDGQSFLGWYLREKFADRIEWN